MLIIIGLIILIAALVIGVAGVLGNNGSTHPLGHAFAVFGYHVTGSAGNLFLAGLVVGAAGLLGLSLLLTGARRTARRGSSARRSLQQSRRETAAVSQDRDDLIGERDAARAYTASTLGNGTSQSGPGRGAEDHPRKAFSLLGRRFGPWQATTAQSDPPSALVEPAAPADPASGETAVPPTSVPDSVSAE
jgi:hypothetical protein